MWDGITYPFPNFNDDKMIRKQVIYLCAHGFHWLFLSKISMRYIFSGAQEWIGEAYRTTIYNNHIQLCFTGGDYMRPCFNVTVKAHKLIEAVTHICVNNLTTIGSDNDLSPGRIQAVIWTNAEILLIWPIGTKFNEISIEIHTFSLNKIHFKISSGKWRPFCLCLNVLISSTRNIPRAVIWLHHRYRF